MIYDQLRPSMKLQSVKVYQVYHVTLEELSNWVTGTWTRRKISSWVFAVTGVKRKFRLTGDMSWPNYDPKRSIPGFKS